MLRGLLSRKKQFDDAAKAQFAMTIAEMLKLQIMVAGNASFEDENGQPKRKALGYVYGYIDAALRKIGQDMSDMSIGVPITFHVIRKLWPDRANEYMDFLARTLNNDELLMVGMMHGGKPGPAAASPRIVAPGAVGGEPDDEVVEQDLSSVFHGKTSKAIGPARLHTSQRTRKNTHG